jgi:hypothetical protein
MLFHDRVDNDVLEGEKQRSHGLFLSLFLMLTGAHIGLWWLILKAAHSAHATHFLDLGEGGV